MLIALYLDFILSFYHFLNDISIFILYLNSFSTFSGLHCFALYVICCMTTERQVYCMPEQSQPEVSLGPKQNLILDILVI